jgi:hypothetical protein
VRSGRAPEVTGEEGVSSLEIAISCLPGSATAKTAPSETAPAETAAEKRRALG